MYIYRASIRGSCQNLLAGLIDVKCHYEQISHYERIIIIQSISKTKHSKLKESPAAGPSTHAWNQSCNGFRR